MGWRTKRILQAGATVYFVTTISFVLVRFMPGSPLDYIVAQAEGGGGISASGSSSRASQEDIQEVYELAQIYLNMNPAEPLHKAYIDYMISTLQGDLGQSIIFTSPVSEILGGAIPWTLFVLSWGLLISFTIGVVLGALMAYWEGGKLDIAFTTYSIVMNSIPYYVMALLLVIFMAYRTGWFPTGGRYPTGETVGFNLSFISAVIHHATLPVLSTVVLSGVASLSMRGNSIRVLGEDYLRVARLRGLSDRMIAIHYVARNAILPMYTGLMISIGTLLGGSTILEIIFTYRGVGWYLVKGAASRDYPLMMGGFVIITIAVVIALLIADLTYGMLDPRAGSGGDREAF